MVKEENRVAAVSTGLAWRHRGINVFFLVILCLAFSGCSVAFAPTLSAPTKTRNRGVRDIKSSQLLPLFDKKEDAPETVDPLTKGSWYAVEAFGKVFGSKRDKAEPEDGFSTERTPKSVEETLQRIQDDFDRSYFLSGKVDALIYDEDCVFSDPFVSFEGRDRFIENLQNLGSFVTKFSVKLLKFETTEPLSVKSKAMVKLELGLPWRPVLAWPWGVEYTIDSESFLVVDHKETWDVAPLEGIKQIFRKPTVQISES